MASTQSTGDIVQELAKERERLEKLWDAYEIQEREYREALAKIELLTNQLKEKERVIDGLKTLLAQRDEEIRELQLKLASVEQLETDSGSRIEDLEKEINTLKEKYRKLFALAEELEGELYAARKGIERRDEWFRAHIKSFLNLIPAVEEREKMIVMSEKVPKVIEGGKVASMELGAEEKSQTTTEMGITDVEVEEKVEEPINSGETIEKVRDEEGEVGLSREELIDTFMMIPSVTRTMAEALVDAGYKDIEDIKNADVGALAVLKGFNPTLARIVKKDVESL